MTTPIQTTMSTQTFGIEIETAGQGTAVVARILAAALPGSTLVATGGYYQGQAVRMADGRSWTVVTDGSIRGVGAEVVSPICKGDADVEMVQVVVRGLRAAGLRSSAADGCGIHVHVGVGHLDAAGIVRVAKVGAAADALVRKAAQVSPSREGWCKPLPGTVVRSLARHTDSLASLRSAWYARATGGGRGRDGYSGAEHTVHYHSSRYHGVNLHSVFYAPNGGAARGTVEFRYFDGTLHAGKIRAYITLCLALVAKARTVVQNWRPTSFAADQTATRAQVESLLIRGLGLSGAGMENVRSHLLAAWGEAPVATVAA